MHQNIQECAEKCYFPEKCRADCVAFVKDKMIGNCKLCNPANQSEIMNSNKTHINENHIAYILKYNKKKPVMYLPLDVGNILSATVIGDGVNGTLFNHEDTKIQAGKVNQGFHVSNRARVVLDGTAHQCVGNLVACPNGLSIAMWINPSIELTRPMQIAHSGTAHSVSFRLSDRSTIEAWTTGPLVLQSKSTVPVGTWTHVTVLYDPGLGLLIYLDGILEAIQSTVETNLESNSATISDYVFGSKANGQYPFDGTLDEIKIFYDILSSAGRFTNLSSWHLKTEISHIPKLNVFQVVFHNCVRHK